MQSCPTCGSFRTQSRGPKPSGSHQFFCNSNIHPEDVSRFFVIKGEKNNDNRSPKILLFDTETSRMNVNTFGLYDQNISIDDIVQDWFMICFSAKWLYDDSIMSSCVTPTEAKNRDDYRVVKNLWDLIDEADFVIAHNIKFDINKSNSRFAYHGFYPPSHYREIDTLAIARTYFKFSSNKLDYLGEYLGLGRKIHNARGLWEKCESGDLQSLRDMQTYCNMDTLLLEKVYLKLRPFAKNHPSLSTYGEMEDERCPMCFAKDSIVLTDSKLYDNQYKVGKCSACGAPVRSHKSEGKKKNRMFRN